MRTCLNCGFKFINASRKPIDYGPGVTLGYSNPVTGENWPCVDACPKCGSDALEGTAPQTEWKRNVNIEEKENGKEK